MARLHKALKGKAKKKVSHLMANPLNINKLLVTLEECFGRPEFVLDYLVEKAKCCDRVEPNKPETLVAFGDAVEALVTNICSYNKTDYMNNKQLTKELIDKLPGPLRSRWYEWRAEDDNRETNLVYFSNWIKLKVKAARLQITPKVSSSTDDEENAAHSRRTKRGPATLVADDASSEEDSPDESSDDVEPTWTPENEVGRTDDQLGGRKCWKVGWEKP
ncbi:unnamed protein product [Orchesella dallaii]|uniref:Uncharacterized protein n=1 Tax=Orchesella dallaii TaxID=48710 RepID=A0ABP1S0G8_9HEXA